VEQRRLQEYLTTWNRQLRQCGILRKFSSS
jgi:hypothetical protein